MQIYLTWIFLLVMHLVCATSRPLEENIAGRDTGPHRQDDIDQGSTSETQNEKVISVRITSSVAVGRGKGKSMQITKESPRTEFGSQNITIATQTYDNDMSNREYTISPPNLEGANIEFIKQLNAKKEIKIHHHNLEAMHPYELAMHHRNNGSDFIGETIAYESKKIANANKESPNEEHVPQESYLKSINLDMYGDSNKPSSVLEEALNYSNERLTSNATDDLFSKAESKLESEMSEFHSSLSSNKTSHEPLDDSIAEPSIKSVLELINSNNDNYENIENLPLARSVAQSPSSKNFIQGLTNKSPRERESSVTLTTVRFNVVHDTPKTTFPDPTKQFVNTLPTFIQQRKFYEHPKVYSQPSQIYSEPAKFYSEPAKIYSEPAKIYSEPAKVYSEPSKIYSEPAKFYSKPASLHLEDNGPSNYFPWQQRSQPPSTTFTTTPVTTITLSDFTDFTNTQPIPEQESEKNYEVDEKISVLTDGRSHGVQESTTEKCKQDNCKVGYVVKGRQYNKYRVEERTSDGFIVGEYGVVRNEDGALRGVRYTADSDASPRLIYDALMKFLQLK